MFQIRESKAEQEKPPSKNDPESNEWCLDEKTMIMNDKKIEMISIAHLAIYTQLIFRSYLNWKDVTVT